MRFRAHRVPALVLCLVAASAFAQDTAPPAPPAPPVAPPAPPAEAVGEKIRLVVRMEKGQKLWLEQSTTMEQDMDMGMMQMNSQTQMNQIMAQVCEAVDDKGVMSLRSRIGRVWGSMVNPQMGEVAFDSDKPDEVADNPMVAEIVRAITSMSGTEIVQKLTPEGKSTEVGLPEGTGDPAVDAQVRQMLDGLSAVATLPDKAVGVGDTWEVSTSVSMPGVVMTVKMKSTMKKIETERVTVGVEGSVAMGIPEGDESGGNPMAALFQRMKITESSVKGTSVFSRKDGLPLTVDIDQVLTMKMDESPEAPSGISFKQTTKQKIRRVDEPAAPKKAETPAPMAPTPATPAGPGTGEK